MNPRWDEGIQTNHTMIIKSFKSLQEPIRFKKSNLTFDGSSHRWLYTSGLEVLIMKKLLPQHATKSVIFVIGVFLYIEVTQTPCFLIHIMEEVHNVTRHSLVQPKYALAACIVSLVLQNSWQLKFRAFVKKTPRYG